MATNASDLLGDFLLTDKNVEGLDSDFLAGGGADQAEFLLNFFRETETAERGRTAGGLDLARLLLDLQRDPTNFAAAIQAQGLFGGNAATAAAQRGGAVSENPNNALLQALLGGIGEFALGDGNLPAGPSQGGTSAAQLAHNEVIAGGTNKVASTHTGTDLQLSPTFAPVSGTPNAGGNVTPSVGSTGQIGEITTPSPDRSGLPENVRAAIKQFEAGQGDIVTIGQASKDAQMRKLNARNVAQLAGDTTSPAKRGMSNIEALFDSSTLEGGHTLTSPQLIEQTIRSAIGKRQTKKGARNQVLDSVVGKAINGAA